MRFQLILIFWGKRFARYLCEDALPPLLVAGNLPDWPWLEETSLEIYCPPEDWQAIAQEPVLQDCQKWVKVNWHNIEVPQTENKYQKMGRIHAHAIDAAIEAKASVILLGPDCVFCAGTFQTLAKHLQAGAEMVLIPGPIVSSEFYHAHKSETWSKEWGRSLIQKAAHPGFRAAHLGQQTFPEVPSCLLYTHKGHLKGRFFHLHPLLIRHPVKMEIHKYQLSPTIDGEYLQEFLTKQDKTHIDQTQEIVAFSFHSEQEAREQLLPLGFREKLAQALRIARGTYRDFHYWLAKHEIQLGEADPSWSCNSHNEELSYACAELVCLALDMHQAYLKQDWQHIVSQMQYLRDILAKTLSAHLDLLDLELLMPFYQSLLALFCLHKKTELEATLPSFEAFIHKLANEIPDNDLPGFSELRRSLSAGVRSNPRALNDRELETLLPNQPFFLVALQEYHDAVWLPWLESEQKKALVLLAPGELFETELGNDASLSQAFEDLVLWEAETLSIEQKGRLVDQAVGVILEGHFRFFNLALRACLQGNLHAIL